MGVGYLANNRTEEGGRRSCGGDWIFNLQLWTPKGNVGANNLSWNEGRVGGAII